MTTLSCIIIHCYTLLFSVPTNGNTIQVIDPLPERRAELREIVEFYLNYFEIENQKVSVFMSPVMPDNYKAYLMFAGYDEDGCLGFTQINVDNKLKGDYLAKVIAHEIYHIKQMVDKKLFFEYNSSVVKWNGKSFKNIGAIPYEKRPWEQDCLKREFTFANAYSKFRKKALKPDDLKGKKIAGNKSAEEQIIGECPDKKRYFDKLVAKRPYMQDIFLLPMPSAYITLRK